MIFGAFKCTPEGSVSFFSPPLSLDLPDEIIKVPVKCDGFDGGYFLNSRLPYQHSDSCYNQGSEIIVLMSGSIYNRADTNLFRKGNFNIPDPELVALLFRDEGPDFVKRLNGDFSICILSPQESKLWLYRDHLGIRPLAWGVSHDTLYFSSEMNSLCSHLSSDEPLDQEYLMYQFKFVDLRNTPSEKVRKVPPGHWLRFDIHGVEVKKYWEPEKLKTDRGLTYNRVISDLKNLSADAVRIRCDERFTAGVHVSGGLDSSVIASLVRKRYEKQEVFNGFSLTPAIFDASVVKYDEREMVMKLCDMTGMIPSFSDMKTADLIRYLGSYYTNQGYFVENKIIEQAVLFNVNLLFSGWGGDEFVSTGSRAIDSDLFRRMRLGLFFRRHPVKKFRKMLGVITHAILLPALGIVDRKLGMSLRQDAQYLKPASRRSNRRALRNYYFHSSRKEYHIGMLRHYHLQQRCEAWSIMGFLSGVEYRYPLLDRRLIEYVIKIPSEILAQASTTRPVMREVAKGLIPEEIRLNRSKADPVFGRFLSKIFAEAGNNLSGEINEWRKNPDLSFADFENIERDLRLSQEEEGSVDTWQLYRTIVYLKAIHEFSERYHRRA